MVPTRIQQQSCELDGFLLYNKYFLLFEIVIIEYIIYKKKIVLRHLPT